MGWYSMLFGKITHTNTAFENPPPSYIERIPLYMYNSAEMLLTQTVSIPHALKHLWTHEPSKTITLSFLDTLKDIIPLLIVNTGINYLSSCLDQEAPLLSMQGSLCLALELVNQGIHLHALSSFIKSTVISVCAPTAINQSNVEQKNSSKDCTPKCQGMLTLLNGAAFETTAYYSNLLAVGALAKVPYVGIPLSNISSIYATGRYVAGLTAPRCSKHQCLKSEATLSLGVIFTILEYILWKSLQSSIGLPSFLIMKILSEIPLLLTIAIAATQKNALTISVNQRTLMDPIEIYEKLSVAVFGGACLGLKEPLKQLLSGPPSKISWAKIGHYLMDLMQYPYLQDVKKILLPQMLQDWSSFINEPIISPHWTSLQKQLIFILSTLEQASRSNIINIAQISPKKAAYLFQFTLGIPIPIAKILLEIMGNDNYMAIVEALRRRLELNEVKKDSGLADLPSLIPLYTLENKKKTSLPIIKTELSITNVVPLPTPDLNKFFQPKIQNTLDPSKHLAKRRVVNF